MARSSRPGGKAARDELRTVMLSQGSSVDDIADEFRARWQFTPLAAYRYAAGLTQMQAAARYNDVVGDDKARVDASLVSKLEQWPVARGSKAPTAYNLTVLAVVYETAPHRLVGRMDLDKLPRKDQLVLNATQDPPASSPNQVAAPDTPQRGNRVAGPVVQWVPDRPYQQDARTDPIKHRDVPLDVFEDWGVDRLVAAAADQSRDFAAWTESSDLGPATMDMYRSELRELSNLFLHQPIATLFPRLVQLRSAMLGHLYRHQPLRRSRELYALTGMACVVLAHASHVLGNRACGAAHTRLARLCAQEADHVELHAWALGTQALLAESDKRPADALRCLSAAGAELQRSRVPGTAAVRLASYEGRISARVGDQERAHAALATATNAREYVGANGDLADLDDIGGILSFPAAKHEFFSAETNLLLGRNERAEHDAAAAIAGYTGGPPEQRSYGDLALAWLDVAAARLANGDLDGVQEAIQPVLALPGDLRIEPLRVPLSALVWNLAQHRYHGSQLARDVRTALESYDLSVRGVSAS